MKNWKMLTLILLLSSTASCAIRLPNIEVCGKTPEGAICAYSMKGEKRKMTEAEWNKLGRISMSAKAYGELKKFILASCKRSKQCSKKQEKQIIDFLEDY